MTASKSEPTGISEGRAELARQILDEVDERHDGKGRRAVNSLLGSFQRICTRASDMLDRDERWRVGENASADDVMDVVFDSVRDSEQEYRRSRLDDDQPEQPKAPRSTHPLGSVAEQLVAKTLATFAGREAVEDLSKWTNRAESKILRRSREES